MQNENVKIFKVRGEYKMSEDDNFKTAKSRALDSAEKNLGVEVENFLRERISNLDENDFSDISAKFLKKSEPSFIRENLPDGEMICYAELNAEINLTAFDNFEKNFEVLKLEKKVEKLQADLKDLQYKHDILQSKLSSLIREFFDFVGCVVDIKSGLHTKKHNYLTLGDRFRDCGEYWEAMKWYEKAKEDEKYQEDKKYQKRVADRYSSVIRSIDDVLYATEDNYGLFFERGYANASLERYDEAIKDYTEAIELRPNFGIFYAWRARAYMAIGEYEKAKEDQAKYDELK